MGRVIKFKDFLKRSKIPIEINDTERYKRVTIKIKHGGVSLRDEEIGKLIGTKKQFVLKEGQFILSKIDARYGAFGIAPAEVDNAIITGNFWAYNVDFNLIDIGWFNQFTNSQFFYDLCERASSGITHRKYLSEDSFLNNEIDLPSLDDQKKSIKKISELKNTFSLASAEITHQLDLIKDLRQAFLREAMQGKLVNNDTSDGKTGADLLQEIQFEKEKLIKEKKIKKSKPLAPISEDEIPFEIPQNWVWCKAGEISYSIVPNRDKPKSFTGDIPWITQTNFSEKSFKLDYSKTEIGLSETEIELYNCRIMPVNSIVMSCVGRFDLVCLLDKAIVANQQLHCFVPFNNISPKYLTYNIKLFSKFIIDKAIKTTIMYVNKEKCESIKISLPPLEIQERIVTKLDELMDYCDDLEKSVKESQNYNEQLLQQVLREALEGKNNAEDEKLQLVAEESPIYSISKDIQKNCDTGDMAILAGYIIKKLSTQNSKDFGRVKLQKMLHLVQYHCQLSSELKYQKNVAGPYAWELEHVIEPKLKSLTFFEIKKDNFGATSKVTYTPLSASNELTSLFNREFKDQAESINNLLNKFQDKTWEFCERISTMYAVWNNRLIRKELFTDEILKQDFLAWDDKKKRFIDVLDHTIEWIRKAKIEPVGFGDYIDKK
ncbi:restriction endonuclease subunit S [Chryseobacterium cucumeris]|uniref:restriction endonuclease subunit S n=1 Tax=Chryseobacterium cucumeris TaxID=1813611 RepID=UPI003D961573